jgi:hypothetical protein
MKPLLKKSLERPGCAKPINTDESIDDLFKSDNPEIRRKLDIWRSMLGMWADKDTSFFDEK